MTDETETSLWADMKSAIRDAFSAWGEPQVIVAHGPLRPHEARLLRRWLASFEIIVRALLVPMALRLVPALSSRAQRGTPARTARPAQPPAPERTANPEVPRCDDDPSTNEEAPAPAEGGAPAAPASSETWSVVRFRLARSARKAAAATRSPGPRGAPGGPAATLALARRFEALIRVVQKPEPHARRLARLLARDRHAAAHVLARPEQDDGPVYYGDIVEEALALAWTALGSKGAGPAADTG